ncbi:hypothetical protein [Lysinibacillus fusiformis]|uniref:hypothetical protein n=1 Tax=Lysinibacillus fusiformis TaxID=28031 RepID=UPI00263AE18F|nr:hypothetical protein [Lysinibacillus fusiformis]MDC6267365.1 hypothetical protein [Lysinibacillus sphaericus]MDN4968201.1 hypothetical protein [Lysinibacillus fusiformis]MDN4968375.1 hypothetical protein [Lysinibacillus fusiformis]
MSDKNLKLILVGLLSILSALLIFIPFVIEGLLDNFIGVTTLIIGLLLGGVSIGLFIRFNENKPHLVKQLKDEIKFKYQLDDLFVSNDLSGVVGYSKERNTLYLMTRADIATGVEFLDNQYLIDAFPLDSVTKLNIIENDNVIINSSTSSSIDQSVSGGFGNEGIQNKKTIYKVRIQAITKDVIKPSSEVFLYSSNIGLKRNSSEQLELYKTLNDLLDKMKIIIKRQMSY